MESVGSPSRTSSPSEYQLCGLRRSRWRRAAELGVLGIFLPGAGSPARAAGERDVPGIALLAAAGGVAVIDVQGRSNREVVVEMPGPRAEDANRQGFALAADAVGVPAGALDRRDRSGQRGKASRLRLDRLGAGRLAPERTAGERVPVLRALDRTADRLDTIRRERLLANLGRVHVGGVELCLGRGSHGQGRDQRRNP